MLAVIACCDAFLLGILAITLSYKQIRLEDKEQGGFLINNMELSSEIKHHQQQILSPERSVLTLTTKYRDRSENNFNMKETVEYNFLINSKCRENISPLAQLRCIFSTGL